MGGILFSSASEKSTKESIEDESELKTRRSSSISKPPLPRKIIYREYTFQRSVSEAWYPIGRKEWKVVQKIQDKGNDENGPFLRRREKTLVKNSLPKPVT